MRAFALALTIGCAAACDRAVAQEAPPALAPAGAPVAGMSLAIAADSASYCVGNPIRLAIEIQNRSPNDISLLAPYVASFYGFRVVDANTGRSVPERSPHRSGDDIWGGLNMHLPAGLAYRAAIRLDDLVALDAPGSYRVTLFTKMVQNRLTGKDIGTTSNTVSLRITACSTSGVVPSSSTLSGCVENGAALAIDTPLRAVLGKPIRVRLELRNVSRAMMQLLGPEIAGDYTFDVTDATTGKPVQKRMPPRTGGDVYAGGGMWIPSAQAYVMTVDLNDLVFFERPGRYRIRVSTAYVRHAITPRTDIALTSNTISFDLLR